MSEVKSLDDILSSPTFRNREADIDGIGRVLVYELPAGEVWDAIENQKSHDWSADQAAFLALRVLGSPSEEISKELISRFRSSVGQDAVAELCKIAFLYAGDLEDAEKK